MKIKNDLKIDARGTGRLCPPTAGTTGHPLVCELDAASAAFDDLRQRRDALADDMPGVDVIDTVLQRCQERLHAAEHDVASCWDRQPDLLRAQARLMTHALIAAGAAAPALDE